MTSRRSPPRRSSGSRARAALGAAVVLLGVAVLLGGVVLLGGALVARAAAPSPLVETRDGVEIDWAAGTVTVGAGAAADLRMPGADLARPGAVRRAEAMARAHLARALAALPLGGARKPSEAAVERAVGRARLTGTDYQSNGGALVRVTARFSDWLEAAPADAAPPVLVLVVPAMRFGAAPLARLGAAGPESPLGAAIYRVGAPPHEAQALSAKVDRTGHLVIEGAPRTPDLAQKLARGTSLIYVEKVLK
jgi:hypothetical protein